MLVYGASRNFISFNRIDLLFFLLCVFVLIWAVIYKVFGNEYQTDPDIFYQSLSGVLIWGANYILFRGFVGVEGKKLWLFAMSAVMMLALVLMYQKEGVFIARQLVDGTEAGDGGVVASYQGFSRSAVMVLFILLASFSRKWLLPAYLSGLSLLFLLSARSEFGGFLVAGFVVMFMRIGFSRFLLFASPAFFLGVFMLSDVATEFAGTSRIFRLLDWKSDTSLEARIGLNSNAWQSIREHPFLGDYGSYVASGGIGDYAHNMLSAWVDFGLIGFIGFTCLVFGSFVLSAGMAWRTRKSSTEANFAAGVAIFGLILALTAKSMFFPPFAAAWGAAAGLHEIRRKKKSLHARSPANR